MESQCNANNTVVLTYESQFDHLYTTPNRLFVTVCIPLISTFGIINNLAFLIVLYRVKTMRTATNFYLGNLAFSDTAFLIVMLTKYTWTYLWMAPVEHLAAKSTFGCSAPYVVIYTFLYSSVFLLTAVTTERYFAICYPLRHRALSRKTRATGLVAISWLLSIAFALFEANPANLKTTCLEFPDDSIIVAKTGRNIVVVIDCIVRCEWCWNATYFVDTAQFFAAFFVNFIMYLGIVRALNQRDVYASSANARGSVVEKLSSVRSADIRASIMKSRNTVARMLAINSVVFFVCLFPFKVTNLHFISLLLEGPPLMSNATLTTLSWLGRVSALVNASSNPLIYGVTNPRYRVAFCETFACRRVLAKDVSNASIAYGSTENTSKL